jgi:hypothetical protein
MEVASVSDLIGRARQAEQLARQSLHKSRQADAAAYTKEAARLRGQAELLRSMRRAQVISHEPPAADEIYVKALPFERTHEATS